MAGTGALFPLGQSLQHMAQALHASQAALSTTEARFHQLADATLEAIFFHEQGTILDVNSRAEQLLGRPAADVVYRHILNVASRRPLQLRLVATVIGGKTYSLRCSYPADLAAEYDAVCDAIRDSARLR